MLATSPKEVTATFNESVGPIFFRILDTKPSMDPNLDGPDLAVDRGAVVFEDVTFGYRRHRPVLRHFDFHAPAGKVTALVGPSGSGKSTIISLIERFYAAGSTLGDKARILSGKPPVPLGAALTCLIGKGRA